MSRTSPSDYEAMRTRTEKARNPAKAQADEAVRLEKHAAGQEKQLQDQIQQFAEMKGCYVLRARMDRKSTLNHAHPDLTIWCNGRCIALEIKVEGGKTSFAQDRAIQQLRYAGCIVEVCWNLKDACDLIIHHLFTP